MKSAAEGALYGENEMTMKQILELRQKRANLITQARSLLETAESGQREFSAEENEQYTRLIEEANGFGRRADRLERQVEMEQELGQGAGNPSRPESEDEDEGGPELRGRASTEYRRAFESYIRNGGQEHRALQMDDDEKGGYLVPAQFMNELIQALDDSVYIRQWARVIPLATADSLGVPTLAADPADPTWTSEIGTGDEDATMKFGKRALRPHPLAKRIKVSRTLLRRAPGVESLVRERLTYKFAVTMEKAYLVGSGSSQPLGVFTASADGIPTSRDEATGNEGTSMTFLGLTAAKFKLAQGYWSRARWMFHPDGMKQLVSLVDGEGQYLWRENVRAGEPDTLLGLPVFMSEFVPNTFTTGLYVGILGDFSNYWIADALDMELQRLDEIYAETNQVGFIGRMESDGAPVLAEAFVRVKLG